MGMFLSLAPRITAATDPTFVQGYLDGYSLNGVSGWAGPGPTHVTVTVNSVLVATVATTDTRPDVNAVTGYNTTGFSYSFVPPLDGTVSQTILVQCHGNTLTNGSAFIPAGGGTGTAYYTDPATQLPPVIQGIAATMPNNDTELASHPSVIFYEPFDSTAAMQTRWIGASTFYGTSPTVDQPTVYFTDPLTGIKMLQIPIDPTLNPNTGASWYRLYSGDPTVRELWCRYLLMIDPDVIPQYDSSGTQISGMHENGIKLTGMAGEWEQAGQWNQSGAPESGPQGWSYRMEAAAPVSGVFPFTFYAYDYQNNGIEGNSIGSLRPVGQVAMRAGQIYCIEQRLKLNTFVGASGTREPTMVPQADGEVDIWVDGSHVYSETGRKIRGDTRATYQMIPFSGIFHGGSQAPITRIHLRLGGICTATAYIGPPKRITSSGSNATSNAFFAGLALNTWTAIPATSQALNCPSLLRTDYAEFSLEGGTTGGQAQNSQTFEGLYEWAGAAYDSTNNRFYQRGGGHFSTNNNGMYCFDVEAGAGAATHGGWSIPFQPSVYTVADFNRWRTANGGDVHFEHGYVDTNNIEVIPGAWSDGKSCSQHFYCDLAWSNTNQAVFHGQERLGSPGKFWVMKSDGTQIQINGNAYSNGPYQSGVTETDEVNNVMLGFRNWPGNSFNTGVRRFDLANKVDLSPINLQVLTAASGYTIPGYGPNYPWANNGCGIMVGRDFYYQNSESAGFPGWVTNIDSWVAKESPWNAPEYPLPGGCYSADSGYMYAFGNATHRLMRGKPGLTWEYAPEAGTIPIANANAMLGPFGRFRYYAARKCLVLINSAAEHVMVMRVA